METAKPIFDRLPAFYRENPDILGALVDALDDVLSGVSFRFGSQEDRILARLLHARLERLTRAPELSLEGDGARRGQATLEGFRRYLRLRHGHDPWIWTRFRAVEGPPGWLVLRPSATPSVIVAWERASPGAASMELPPAACFPIGVDAWGISLQRPPARSTPLAGERLRGSVEWALTGRASSMRMGAKEVKSP